MASQSGKQEREPRRQEDLSILTDSKAEVTEPVSPELTAAEKEMRARRAVYLIEREAIQFRRQLWAPPSEQLLSVAERERLSNYDRPKQTIPAAEASPIRRAGSWIKSFFSGPGEDNDA